MQEYHSLCNYERRFIQRYVQEENANKMWINVFRDVLSEALNFRTIGIQYLINSIHLQRKLNRYLSLFIR